MNYFLPFVKVMLFILFRCDYAKRRRKLEQDKTDEVKASSSLVSVTESADKDLVEKDIKEETADESQAAQTDNSESITDKDNSESADNQNTQSADSKVAEHQ